MILLHTYRIFKMWILYENKKFDIRKQNLLEYIRKELFNRSLYNDSLHFKMLTDRIINKL